MTTTRFAVPETIPPRVNLKTGEVRTLDVAAFSGKVAGGTATIFDLPLRSDKALRSLEVRALANEVVIGLTSAALES